MATQALRELPVYQTDGPLGVFKDAAMEAEFRSAGFVKFTPFSAQEAADLRREAAEFMAKAKTNFATSIDLTSIFAEPEYRREIHDWLSARVADRCLAHLDRYKVAQAGLSRKPVGAETLRAHVAWTLMKDPKTIGVTAWVALEDVDLSKGAMRFMKGGHGLGWPAWGPALPLTVDSQLLALEPDMTTYTVKAGEGFLFDSYLPHGSTANTTDKDRLAVRIQMIPEEAEAVVHGPSKTDPSLVDLYPSDAVHLTKISQEQFAANEMAVEPISSYPRTDFKITDEEFLEAVRHSDAIRAGERDLASFANPPAPPQELSFMRRLRMKAGKIKRRVLGKTEAQTAAAPY